MGEQTATSSASEADVFNQDSTPTTWDDDYYHPIAVDYYDAAIPAMLSEMGAGPGDRVLDAGCGPGVHSIRAAKYGCMMMAVDLSTTMLAHAKERAQAAGVAERITFRQCDLTRPDLGERFDFVFSWGVVIHVPDTEASLDGVCSMVAPGGNLAFQVLNAQSLDFRLERALRKILRRPFKEPMDAKLGAGNWYAFGEERLWVLRFDMQALDAYMKSKGFTLKGRRTAEFSEFQRRVPEFIRRPLLHLNSWMFRRRKGTALSATQIVFYTRDA